MGRKFVFKNFSIIMLAVFSVASILIVAFAIRNSTSTRTIASGSCALAPVIQLESTNKHDTYNVYQLTLLNPCDKPTNFLVKVSQFPQSPKKLDNWTWKFKNENWNTTQTLENVDKSTNFSLTIQRPLDDSGLLQDIPTGIYSYFLVEAGPSENPSITGDIELTYSVN